MQQRMLYDPGTGAPAGASLGQVGQRHHSVLGGGHPLPLPPSAHLDPVHPPAPAVVAVQHGRVRLGVRVGGPQRTHHLGRERLERTIGRGQAVVAE